MIAAVATIGALVSIIATASVRIMTTGRIEMGPTARAVAANLRRLREARGMSLRTLSAEVQKVGRTLSADAINKIENGRLPEAEVTAKQIRRADVDDLTALALALNVSPIALLLPPEWGSTPVPLTASVEVPAQVAWLWAQGEAPAEDIPPGNDEAEHAAYWRRWEAYQALTHPPERRGIGTYMGRALGSLRTEIDRLTHAVRMELDEGKFDQQVERVRTWISRLQGEVDQLEAQRRGPKRPPRD